MAASAAHPRRSQIWVTPPPPPVHTHAHIPHVHYKSHVNGPGVGYLNYNLIEVCHPVYIVTHFVPCSPTHRHREWCMYRKNTRAPFQKGLRLIASCTQFAIELRWISIVRLIATLCKTGPVFCTLSSVISNFQTRFVRTDGSIKILLDRCRRPAIYSVNYYNSFIIHGLFRNVQGRRSIFRIGGGGGQK